MNLKIMEAMDLKVKHLLDVIGKRAWSARDCAVCRVVPCRVFIFDLEPQVCKLNIYLHFRLCVVFKPCF